VSSISSTITVGADDGHVRKGSDEFYATSTRIAVGFWSSSNEQAAWLRFSGFSIPSGATITAASITLDHIDAQSGDEDIIIRGEDTLNPSAPTNRA
jgi:hypothetical protein